MPTAPLSPCPVAGCPHLGRCPTHTVESRQARPNRQVRKWYLIARWRHPVWGRRAQVLARDPLCVECRKLGRITPTTDIDHVIPHEGDPVRFWDPGNLQGLCASHHSQKTQGEKR